MGGIEGYRATRHARARGHELDAVAQLVDRWLAWVGKNKSVATLRSSRNYGKRWAELKNKDGKVMHGNLPAASIRGYHVTELCDEAYPVTKGYSDSVRWQAQKVAVVMFSWAKSEGLIDVNPLVGYRKSAKCGVREKFILEADYLKLLTGSMMPTSAT